MTKWTFFIELEIVPHPDSLLTPSVSNRMKVNINLSILDLKKVVAGLLKTTGLKNMV